MITLVYLILINESWLILFENSIIYTFRSVYKNFTLHKLVIEDIRARTFHILLSVFLLYLSLRVVTKNRIKSKRIDIFLFDLIFNFKNWFGFKQKIVEKIELNRQHKYLFKKYNCACTHIYIITRWASMGPTFTFVVVNFSSSCTEYSYFGIVFNFYRQLWCIFTSAAHIVKICGPKYFYIWPNFTRISLENSYLIQHKFYSSE